MATSTNIEIPTKIKAIILTAILLAFFVATVIGISYIRKIPSTGTIKTIGCAVYWDQALTQNVTHLDWGILEPGQETSRSLWILNTGNAPANLTLATMDWNPPNASNYISLYWNYSNQTIVAKTAINVTFILAVSPIIFGIEHFSFDIIIIASG